MKLSNMDKTEAWSPSTLLGVGKHEVSITECEEGESSKGNPEFRLTFGNDLGSIRDWLQYTPKTAGKVRQLLDAVGIASEEGEMEVEASQLLDKDLTITVYEEPDRQEPGKMRRRVGAYLPKGSAPDANGNGDGLADDIPF